MTGMGASADAAAEPAKRATIGMGTNASAAAKSAMRSTIGTGASASAVAEPAMKGMTGMGASASDVAKPAMNSMTGICAREYVYDAEEAESQSTFSVKTVNVNGAKMNIMNLITREHVQDAALV